MKLQNTELTRVLHPFGRPNTRRVSELGFVTRSDHGTDCSVSLGVKVKGAEHGTGTRVPLRQSAGVLKTFFLRVILWLISPHLPLLY